MPKVPSGDPQRGRLVQILFSGSQAGATPTIPACILHISRQRAGALSQRHPSKKNASLLRLRPSPVFQQRPLRKGLWALRSKCNPAIKSAGTSPPFSPALLDNRLDIIATDHAPHTWEEKQNSYFQAPSGCRWYNSLNVMEFYHQGKITWSELSKKCARTRLLVFAWKSGVLLRRLLGRPGSYETLSMHSGR